MINCVLIGQYEKYVHNTSDKQLNKQRNITVFISYIHPFSTQNVKITISKN